MTAGSSRIEKSEAQGERSGKSARLAQIRIYSGLILFFYVVAHLFNHAAGLISFEMMSTMGANFKWFWRLPVMSLLLYGALIAHMVTALLVVFNRRTLTMPIRDWIQLLSGIAIPSLLLIHIMGTRYASEVYGITDSYAYVLLSTFVFSPFSGVLNALGLIAAWAHGCLGIHTWLSIKPWYTQRLQSVLLVLATLFPSAALAGYLMAGRLIAPFVNDGEWMEHYYENLTLSSDAVWGALANDIETTRFVLIGALVLLILGRWLRNKISDRQGKITIEYLDGPTVRQSVGATLLETSKSADVPHASVCGGRGRCSTCRVRVVAGSSAQPISDLEQKVLTRIRAPEDVRLACQLVPASDMKVMRLLPSDATLANAADDEPWSSGQEKNVTILFADLRDFTKTSENRLPFDVVYLINQFSRTMGKSVEAHNGRIDKFLGDGLMAIFGIDTSAEQAARDALTASANMRKRLENLNARLADDLDKPLRMGLGVHSGSVVIGDMGYGASRGLTAIGDTVNTASRLETETKTYTCAICVSKETTTLADISLPKTANKKISIRGKSNKLDIYALSDDELEKFIHPQESAT